MSSFTFDAAGQLHQLFNTGLYYPFRPEINYNQVSLYQSVQMPIYPTQTPSTYSFYIPITIKSLLHKPTDDQLTSYIPNSLWNQVLKSYLQYPSDSIRIDFQPLSSSVSNSQCTIQLDQVDIGSTWVFTKDTTSVTLKPSSLGAYIGFGDYPIGKKSVKCQNIGNKDK